MSSDGHSPALQLVPQPKRGRLVGLGGYAMSGKDAVADVLEAGHGWYRTFMSKPLMVALLTLNPLIPVSASEYVTFQQLVEDVGYTESKRNPEVRRLLQVLGTEVGRKMFGETVWIDCVMAEVEERLSSGQDVVITGIRFENELDAIRSADGESFWVNRPGYVPVNSHVSDNTLAADDFDTIINNDGTLQDLADTTTGLVAQQQTQAAA